MSADTGIYVRGDFAAVVASPPGRFGGLSVDHPSVGQPCAICGEPLEEGQAPALVNPRPDDTESWAKAAAGRAYNAMCDAAHESCAYPAELTEADA